MTYGARKRKRSNHIQWCELFNRKCTIKCNPYKIRKIHEESKDRTESKYENCNESRIIRRNRSSEGKTENGVLRQNLSRLYDRLLHCMPFVTQFLSVEDYISFKKVLPIQDYFFNYTFGFKNKTEYMIQFWMNTNERK